MLNKIKRQPAHMSGLAVFVLLSCYACFASEGKSGKHGGGNEVEGAPTPGFVGVELKVLDSTIPPGGLFQFQLMLTEPKPIGHGSTRPIVPTGPVRGIALNDPIGQTAGVAVVNNAGIQVNFNSPKATFGTTPNSDSPILTIAMPIAANMPVGRLFPLSIDTANSLWTDANGQPYPQEVGDGQLTIGGTLAIRDVVPGGGLQPAGTRISIFGMGFTPAARVNMEGVNLSAGDVQFISPSQIDVVLPSALQMDGTRVRVRTQTECSTYFAYLRTQPIGESTHALVAQSYPLFSRKTYSNATLAWTRSGQKFTALALQNPGTDAVEITVKMQSGTGVVLGSLSLQLPGLSKITRDLAELFAGAPTGAVAVSATSNRPIQILGLLGDDATGDVVPVIVTAP